jgi:cell division transport system ATP-binding protein
MLKLENVSKKFGDITALKNVSFDIEDGEFVFLIGPSGAGKTTILRLILREILPDTGELIFDEVKINKMKQKEVPLIRQKIGVVFQDYKIIPESTVWENVEIALAVVGAPKAEWKVRVENVLKLTGLGERKSLFPSQLSGGEVQRLSLARALVVNPRIILADEPTGNLDWETAQNIMRLFDLINKEGKTVLMATHNKQIIREMKKRVIEIKNGEVVSDEPAKGEVETADGKKRKIKVSVEETPTANKES